MSGSNHQTKLLVVDDDAHLRDLVRKIFDSPDYVVLEAEDGATGIAAAVQHLPQLIILDMRMPRMTGLDVIRAVKANKDIKHIPIVIFTAAHSSTQALECIREGAADYITKPIEPEPFRRKVRALLGHPLK